MSREFFTVLLAAIPITELRGSIPLAITMGLSLKKAFIFSVIGNALPIVPLLVLLEPYSIRLRKFRLWKRFFQAVHEYPGEGELFGERLRAFGLMLFVAAPMPGSGVWIGCILASLFRIRFRYAVVALLLGEIAAAAIITKLIAIGQILI